MIAHPLDDIELAALGALDASETASVLKHADNCPSCAVLLADAMAAAAALAPHGERRPPAARLLPRPRGPVSRAGIGALAAVAAVVVAIAFARVFPVAPRAPIAAMVNSHFAHHELLGGPSAHGKAKVLLALDGGWLYVIGDRMTPRADYAVWERAPSGWQMVAHARTTADGQFSAFVEQSPRAIGAAALAPKGEPRDSPSGFHWP